MMGVRCFGELMVVQPPPTYLKDGLTVGVYIPRMLNIFPEVLELDEELCSVFVAENDRVFMGGNLDKLYFNYLRGKLKEDIFYSKLQEELARLKKDFN